MRPPDFWLSSASIRSDLLAPLGAVYGCISASRARRPSTWTAPVPVICVGNVVLGGAGKTPVCRDIAARYRRMGRHPHILSRGYGGTVAGPAQVDPGIHIASDVGDEPLLLARDTPTWVGSDRTASAKCAVDAGADVLIMDDGFQNPGLEKTRNLLVFDSATGVGNGRVFPAGPLREPLAGALARADVLVYVGPGQPVPPSDWSGPVFGATVTATEDGPAALKGQRIIAFAGIGRPDKFFETLRNMGAELVRTRPFSDHHPFRRDEITGLMADAEREGCTLMTTEKDHVRLPADLAASISALPITLHWDDTNALDAFLGDALVEA